MIIRRLNNEQTLPINLDSNFMPDLGREEALVQFEDETLRSIINPAENYETMRFIHKPYSGITQRSSDLECDIWYHFYFYNQLQPPTHVGGLDYSLVDITPQENAALTAETYHSFFKLEFYKVPDGENPERANRRLVFSKTIPMTYGERVFFEPMNEYIHVPVFVGTNYRKPEIMYLFWFQDDTVLNETVLTGNTFYMTARFYNSKDGSVLNLGNKSLGINDSISENNDVYYLFEIDKTDYSYQIFQYNGTKGNRIGVVGNPIKFYEISSV